MNIKVDYPEMGGTYKHYKGGLYKVITMAEHSETNEPMVIYKSLLFGSVYARPLSSWDERVDMKTTGSKIDLRFEWVR